MVLEVSGDIVLVAWFAAGGVIVQRVMSDRGSAYRSHAWGDARVEQGVKPNGPSLPPADHRQIECFHRPMPDG